MAGWPVALHPWSLRLNHGELDWREGATAPLDDQVIATFEKPFSATAAPVLSGNFGDAVMKTSAVPVENQVIEAPAVVFESRLDVLRPWKRGCWTKTAWWWSVNSGQKRTGMPELHKLMPPLGAIVGPPFKIALVTRWPTLWRRRWRPRRHSRHALEAYDGGLLAKVRAMAILFA